MACEFPVAVRRVANCYTPFTLLLLTLLSTAIGQYSQTTGIENASAVLRKRRHVVSTCLGRGHRPQTDMWTEAASVRLFVVSVPRVMVNTTYVLKTLLSVVVRLSPSINHGSPHRSMTIPSQPFSIPICSAGSGVQKGRGTRGTVYCRVPGPSLGAYTGSKRNENPI